MIANTSQVDALTVDRLVDSVYGDLIAGPNQASCTYGGEPVHLPFTLPIGQSMTCTFRVTVTETVTDTVTGSGTDDEGNRVTDADNAVVTVGITPPPLPQPEPPDVGPAGDPQVASRSPRPRRRPRTWGRACRRSSTHPRLERRPRPGAERDPRRPGPEEHAVPEHRRSAEPGVTCVLRTRAGTCTATSAHLTPVTPSASTSWSASAARPATSPQHRHRRAAR